MSLRSRRIAMDNDSVSAISRRTFIGAVGAVAGTTALAQKLLQGGCLLQLAGELKVGR
jgi:hypothetical protein